jgi:3-deoxy-D-manno-octulosonic-acid transferase
VYLLYSAALAAAFLVAAPFYLWKGRGTGKYLASFAERTGRLPTSLNPGRDRSIWIHAVSVGEVLAARALVGPLKEAFPEHKLFVSTTTVAGNGVARKSIRDADGFLFAPFDLPGPVRKALDVLNPALLVLVETEIWPNLIHDARRRGTRVAIVNGRLSERSFAGYRRVRPLLRRVLVEIDLFLMQGEDHARRVRDLGAPAERVRVVGNLKFDALDAARVSDELARLLEAVPGGPLWVAGSTMPGEEEIVLAALRRIRERFPETALIVAPRHPERFDEVPALVEAAGFRCLRRTRLQPGAWRNGSVVLLDTLGELAQVYSLASVVFVGGSLVPTGGHNILEPAVSGKAVIVGPHMENFREIADQFRAEDALVQVRSAEELAAAVTGLLADEARRTTIGARARDLVDRNRGAVRLTVDALAGLVA